MFTLFAIPKAFHGHTGVIQRNAIRSWTLLRPAPEIILFGNDEGTVELAGELGVRSIPDVRRNELGTPYISDVFKAAQETGRTEVFVYCNSDIVLMQHFVEAVTSVKFSRFIMAGQRWDLDIKEPLDFRDGWEERLRETVKSRGHLQSPKAMDYFVFTRPLLSEMPGFLVGRPAWDNWVVFHARKTGVPLIDATEEIVIVHQNHDYKHIPRKEGPQWEGPEARENRKLWSNSEHDFDIEDATHRFAKGIVRRERRWKRLKRNLDSWPVLHPRLGPWIIYPRRFFSRLVLQPFRKIAQSR